MTDDEQDDDRSAISSMPGSFEEPKGQYMPQRDAVDTAERGEEEDEDEDDDHDESYDDDAIFDDDILAAGEMKNVPF